MCDEDVSSLFCPKGDGRMRRNTLGREKVSTRARDETVLETKINEIVLNEVHLPASSPDGDVRTSCRTRTMTTTTSRVRQRPVARFSAARRGAAGQAARGCGA
eukprot:428513-Prymnesium_polylepis.1